MMGRFAWTWGMLCCVALMPARAEMPGECAALFQDAGAIPGTQNCRTDAGNADFGLGTYYCNNPDTSLSIAAARRRSPGT
ncbi:hypothetical protein CEK64_00415 [Xanthomonas sontii]|uniref:hypothetical protein n=1 Tax=Xanthomonas sontii TaxID=2650745 RepID=UPI00123D37E1|nr:hypothetical protein [Xanthomonas sontii]KAA8921765.1 hypothetical protein CEK64_00415 [Xanthomonas sontii]